MKAVYESNKPYLQVSYWDVNATVPVYSEERVTKAGRVIPPKVVGTAVDTSNVKCSDRNRMYTFMEGEKHNQITLTDPIEILNMRKFIRCRRQIKEVYCDGDPVEELKYLEALEDDASEEVNEEHLEDTDDDTYSEWDEKMARRLR